MPEGPSIVILKEQAAGFTGRTIAAASGNSKAVDFARLPGQPIVSLRSWGKHFLIELPELVLRIHFLLFGSYLINERKDAQLRLGLQFDDGAELNFYTCAVKQLELAECSLDQLYDWRADVMSDQWSAALALKKLRAVPDKLACDALLDQHIFSGVGNIIKNEVLFRLRIHPLSRVGALPAAKLRELVKQARLYSFEFKAWKQAFVLRQHWLVHTRTQCPRCNIPLAKGHLGTTKRRSFYCENCQKLY
ncbi:endonuclease [Pseudoduganella sp. LjRoot289]|uniref:DNA-formamidopyrimidine glycosylase family protein n=1 Tax=Pseudoduganella sp. LjRoot289 TaxID=3342314 RepID=UPI003ECE7F6B